MEKNNINRMQRLAGALGAYAVSSLAAMHDSKRCKARSKRTARLTALAIGCISAIAVSVVAAKAETMQFSCSWGEQRPIQIEINTDTMRGTRNDGGIDYQVVKISKWGVWLLLDEPRNVVSAKIQMIERTENPQLGGRWLDIIISLTGSVSSIDGGICWEGN